MVKRRKSETVHLIRKRSRKTWCGRKTFGLRNTMSILLVTCKACKKAANVWRF